MTRKTNSLRNKFKCIETIKNSTLLPFFPIMHYREMASGKISSNEVNLHSKFTTKLSQTTNLNEKKKKKNVLNEPKVLSQILMILC